MPNELNPDNTRTENIALIKKMRKRSEHYGRIKLMFANFAISLNSVLVIILGVRVFIFLLKIAIKSWSVKMGGSIKFKKIGLVMIKAPHFLDFDKYSAFQSLILLSAMAFCLSGV